MGTIIAIIVVALKFFSIIHLSWTTIILFLIAYILIDLSMPSLKGVASTNQISDLAYELENLRYRINNLKEENDNLRDIIDDIEHR